MLPYEADGLVHIDEEGLSGDREKIRKLMEKVFRTVTGKELAGRLYLT
jgi:hypothetical protein